jgi:ElaB/YqjD/DUF883 family membrane-anchored ribosome-binding protein
MNQKQLDRKIKRGAAKVQKDISTLAGDSVTRLSGFVDDVGTAADQVKDDVSTWVDDSVSTAGDEIGKFAEKAQETVGDAAAEVRKNVGHGLSQYNKKAQEIADQVPGHFGEKAANYPWVSITIALVVGLILGFLLRPANRNFEWEVSE